MTLQTANTCITEYGLHGLAQPRVTEGANNIFFVSYKQIV